MTSRVADSARNARRKRELAMTPAERVALALRLGKREVKTFAFMNDLSEAEAKKQIAVNRAKGRRASKCANR
jgi:hypothetical protein